jgi:hypothetical protein
VREFLAFPPSTLNAVQQDNCRRVEAAIAANVVPLEPMIVRSDSSQVVQNAKGDPTLQVAYALGTLAPSDTLIERPGWAGWQDWSGPAIYINRTPNPASPAPRSVEEMAMFVAHEAIHSVDDKPAGWQAGNPDVYDRYCMEFRAYWTDGRFEQLSTDRDETPPFGPKSPRANAVFRQIYDNYDYTREAYDQNTNGFRQRVDNLVFPDGMNLIVSRGLNDLRDAIRNAAGGFSVRYGRVSAAFAACSPTDKAEITRNRAWRDTVEASFNNYLEPVFGASPPRMEPAVSQIKRMLGIPQ